MSWWLQGPKLTFLGRRLLVTDFVFFSHQMEKCGRQRVLTKCFLRSETPIDRKLWLPFFLLRIRTKRTCLGHNGDFSAVKRIVQSN